MMGGFGGWGVMPWFGGVGMVVGMVLWVAVLFLVIWAAMRLFPTRAAGEQETALEILKRRYARGEITAAEFQQAKQDLA